MASRWFRVYSDMVDDPKVQRLPADTFRALVNLWCLAARSEDGRLPAVDDIAFSLRVKPQRVADILGELRLAGLIDDEATDTGTVTRPHNWNSRQFKSDVSNERVKRHRQRHGNGARNVTSRVAETPPETEPDTEQSSSLRSDDARAERDAIDAEFADAFWPVYPHKVGKPSALKAFHGARKRAALTKIVGGLQAYIRDKPPDRPWLNPATFLNQDRFDDQPASPPEQSAKPTAARTGDAFRGSLARIVEARAQPGGSADDGVPRLAGPAPGTGAVDDDLEIPGFLRRQ
jgi:hypothetical protein